MSKEEEARSYLRLKSYPSHIVEGGLERLVRNWERVAESVASGEEQYQDDYLNDMDGRAIIEEVLSHLGGGSEAMQKRVQAADSLIRQHLIPTEECLWGEKNARKYGYSREKDWWYYHRPKVVDDSWRSF